MSDRIGYDTIKVMTTNRLNVLIHDSNHTNKFFIGRYLKNYSDDNNKELAPGEVERISAQGIDIVSLFELCTFDTPQEYSYPVGRDHATMAITKATGYHQPSNTPIYFAIEINFYDLSNDTLLCYKNYLKGIRSILSDPASNPNGYKFGYYGPGYSCMKVKNWYSDAYTMVGNPDYSNYTNWKLKQIDHQVTLTYNNHSVVVDITQSNGTDYGGWQYHQFPNAWSNYNNSSKHRRQCSLCGRYEYQYHIPNATGTRCTVCGYVGDITVPANSVGGDICDAPEETHEQ